MVWQRIYNKLKNKEIYKLRQYKHREGQQTVKEAK